MSDPVEELIKEIAVKHGIAVSRNDPLLILQTINARLMEDSANKHRELLEHHKEELEMISMRWGTDAKGKAEHVLNAALTASKEAMAQLMNEGVQRAAQAMRDEVDGALDRMAQCLQETRYVAMFNIAVAGITSATIFLSLVVWLIWR